MWSDVTLVSLVGAEDNRFENAKRKGCVERHGGEKHPPESLTKLSVVTLVNIGIRGLIYKNVFRFILELSRNIISYSLLMFGL